MRSVAQHTEVRACGECVSVLCSQRDSLDSLQVEVFQKYG